MNTNSTGLSEWATRLRPETETIVWGAIVVNFEILLLFLYATVSESQLTGLTAVRYWLYPFVWINVGIWAIVRTRPTPTSTRHRRIGLALAVGYFGVLAYVGGLIAGPIPSPTGFSVQMGLPPGWGPAVFYSSSHFTITILPYKAIGYAALAYLVYATVLDAAGSAVTGLLGLLSCVSCTWPVLATIITGVFGSGTAIASAVYTQSYGLSTVVFVATVGLLYWRPFGR
ncbi:hypothetical protein ACFR9U_11245 [Halorientalis brevis]|uniref:ABC transporter ATP-binding protein n=1 Tax=Halorientalis brevis TaxID=1126241 RepID=A0ABD6CEA7_9EURY|nr:hypothetical protein [Halorientalis brevis]